MNWGRKVWDWVLVERISGGGGTNYYVEQKSGEPCSDVSGHDDLPKILCSYLFDTRWERGDPWGHGGREVMTVGVILYCA